MSQGGCLADKSDSRCKNPSKFRSANKIILVAGSKDEKTIQMNSSNNNALIDSLRFG